MEGVNWTPEQDTDDDESPAFEKKEKESKKDTKKERHLPLLERKEVEQSDDKKARKKEQEPETVEAEKAVPLESATEDERQLVVEARSNELAPELEAAEPESIEEAVVLADIAYVDAVHAKAEAGESINEDMLDATLAEVVERLDLVPILDEEPETLEDTPTDVIDEIIELDPEDDTEVDLPLTSPTPPPPPPTISGSGAGGSGLPPLTPTGIPTAASFNANTAPTRDEATTTERRSTAGPLLLGGILGYMIGRRRGRIKTEKKLIPIQKKLEAEVKDLHEKLVVREEKIRDMVREQMVKKPEQNQKIVERVLKASEKEKTTPEKPVLDVKPEQLGKFAVLAERPKVTKNAPEQIKSVENLNKAELLSVAERITLEHEGDVRRLYETNRIDDKGLERIVRAYLKGERYDHLIVKNLVTPERYNYAETLQPGANMNNQIQSRTQDASYDPIMTSDPQNPPSATQDTSTSFAPAATKAADATPTSDSQPKSPPPTMVIAVAAVVIALIIIIWLL